MYLDSSTLKKIDDLLEFSKPQIWVTDLEQAFWACQEGQVLTQLDPPYGPNTNPKFNYVVFPWRSAARCWLEVQAKHHPDGAFRLKGLNTFNLDITAYEPVYTVMSHAWGARGSIPVYYPIWADASKPS